MTYNCLHSQLRLAIISLLASVESAEFTFIKEKTEATDWAEYTLSNGEFYFEQSNLSYVRKNGDCYYDVIVADIKSKCKFLGIKEHKGKNKKPNNFTTYDCPEKSYKGEIGFAQVDGNGVVLLFSK